MEFKGLRTVSGATAGNSWKEATFNASQEEIDRACIGLLSAGRERSSLQTGRLVLIGLRDAEEIIAGNLALHGQLADSSETDSAIVNIRGAALNTVMSGIEAIQQARQAIDEAVTSRTPGVVGG